VDLSMLLYLENILYDRKRVKTRRGVGDAFAANPTLSLVHTIRVRVGVTFLSISLYVNTS
jgi:hypothetical protein